MSEGTLNPVADHLVGESVFQIEYTCTLSTGAFRSALKFSDFPRISLLRTLYASVVISNVVAEIRQNTDVGSDDGQLQTAGHIYVAVIPTSKDTDAATGGSSVIVANVPNKQTFPLSSMTQSNEIFKFNLSGFELDLAQDPRRGAGPVAWLGNSGVRKVGAGAAVLICTVTWRATVTCQGQTPVWQ